MSSMTVSRGIAVESSTRWYRDASAGSHRYRRRTYAVRALSAARRRSLADAALGRAVQPDVKAAVLAEHDRRRPAQDHPAAAGQQAVNPRLAVAAQVLVLVVGGRWRLGGPGRHRLGEMGQQPVHRGDLDLLR